MYVLIITELVGIYFFFYMFLGGAKPCVRFFFKHVWVTLQWGDTGYPPNPNHQFPNMVWYVPYISHEFPSDVHIKNWDVFYFQTQLIPKRCR